VQIPGYLEKQDALKAAGIDEVLVYCVNDGAVMQAWAKDQGVEGSLITFMGDPTSTVTKALDMVLDHPGPQGVGLFDRSKRFAAYVVDGEVKALEIAEAENDPAGDEFPEATCVDNMLKVIGQPAFAGEL